VARSCPTVLVGKRTLLWSLCAGIPIAQGGILRHRCRLLLKNPHYTSYPSPGLNILFSWGSVP